MTFLFLELVNSLYFDFSSNLRVGLGAILHNGVLTSKKITA